ncbi:MAG: sensor histidine kinase [Chloroflexota bacterium]
MHLNTTKDETNLLKIYQIYALIRMIAYPIIVTVVMLDFAGAVHPEMFLRILLTGIIFNIYLLTPVFRKWLGSYFLPLGLAYGTLDVAFTQQNVIYQLIQQPPTRIATLDPTIYLSLARLVIWYTIPAMLIIVLIIAWRYRFQHLLTFVTALALIDVIFALVLRTENGNLPLFTLLWTIVPKVSVLLLVGVSLSRIARIQQQQNAALQTAYTQLSEYAATIEDLTVSRERNRMARELHDTLAHTLAAVSLQLGGAKTMLHVDPEQAESAIDQALSSSREGLNETRRALHALRSTPLDDYGLALALEDLAERARQRSGANVMVEISNDVTASTNVQQVIYRVVQEALENSVRHANANQIELRVDCMGNKINAVVKDNGVGFCADDVNTMRHFGLTGMRERVEIVGGNLNIDSKPNHGTRVQLII